MFGATHGWWCNTKTYPTNCPSCNQSVFYFSCDCGCRVFFNKLGPPWPIHSCHSSQSNNHVRKTSPKPLGRGNTVQKPLSPTERRHDKSMSHDRKPAAPKIVTYTGREYDRPKLSSREGDKSWIHIAKAYQKNHPVTGRVERRVKGGLIVIITPGSLYGFLPASQVELHSVQSLQQYVGKVLKMKILNLDRGCNDIILSRRALLETELEKKKIDRFKTLQIGQRVTGKVKGITNFGAFVDLDGVDGLIHKTAMAWKHILHPSEVVSIGEKVNVQIIDIDKENERISLGLKQATLDPWKNAEEKYPVGSTVQGTVINIVDYGAFVQLEEGVEGLIHISELANRRIEMPTEIVTTGEELEVKVISINPEVRRIGLSLKALVTEQHHSSVAREKRRVSPSGKDRTLPQRKLERRKREPEKTAIGLALQKAGVKSSSDDFEK